MKRTLIFIVLLLLVAAAAVAVWQYWPRAKQAESGRKILFYQSAMHPWIKSDKPGQCTICGMQLTPVFEGEKPMEATADMVMLSSNSIQVLNVQTEPVTRGPLLRTLRVAGVILPDPTRRRVISAYVDGRLDQLGANYVGAEVKEGDVLAAIYSPALLTAEREYTTLLQRQTNAFLPGQDRLLEGAAERLRRLGLSQEQIQALPEKGLGESHTKIVAPISGTVVERAVLEGAYVMTGDKLFEIVDYSKMWFEFDVYERDLGWITVGDRVEVRTAARPGKVYPGAIVFIEPNLNAMTRSAKVRVELDNPLSGPEGKAQRELYGNLFAEATVASEAPDVLSVPRTAVLLPGQAPLVYVDQGGASYQQRQVMLGRLGDERWEILQGLEEGERVVTRGNLMIDAQAQLNQSVQHGATPSHIHTPRAAADHSVHANETGPPLAGEQEEAGREYFNAVDRLRLALSKDDLNGYAEGLGQVESALKKLEESLGKDPRFAQITEAAVKAGAPKPGPNLETTRKTFLAVSEASASLAQALRTHGFQGVKVFKCPMYPKMGQTARWIQMEGPLQNPFYGSEMLDCGTEIHPTPSPARPTL